MKRKVAIARFTNETKYGQSFFFDKNQDPIGKQAMDILSARLAATEKFILLERADIEKINHELGAGNLSNLKIPADYLIIGSVSDLANVTGDVGIFSRTKKQTAYAKVNVRLVDVYTSQVIYSEEGAGEAYSETGEDLWHYEGTIIEDTTVTTSGGGVAGLAVAIIATAIMTATTDYVPIARRASS